MWEHFKCFSVKILDYYNITVHLLVCNKLSESIMHGATINTKNTFNLKPATVLLF
jgi:hypothetical protein